MEETPPALREEPVNEQDPDLLLILVIAFLLPGAGHAVMGFRRRGVCFFLLVTFMFSTGLVLGGRLYELDSESLLSVLATVASHGSGLLDLTARFAGWSGDPAARTYEYGTAFVLTAGLMNLLLVFDVWDRLSPEEELEAGGSPVPDHDDT